MKQMVLVTILGVLCMQISDVKILKTKFLRQMTHDQSIVNYQFKDTTLKLNYQLSIIDLIQQQFLSQESGAEQGKLRLRSEVKRA
ncbi:hypothetical protein DP117_09620 [Brasilonema sp. UFV-L1]|nr:hypothetical protein [Brasilonema sp. UFV-L1]